ncbi:YjbQ family protein [candidate division WOR-3 bacterium]|nr:YjbQ family protein [candidate division WOR-3 bacterium]
MYTKEITVRTKRRNEFIEITGEIEKTVEDSKVKDGFVILYVPHTTAGITINENADPSVKADILNTLDKLVPPNAGYSHLEGNADSHIKSTIVGVSQLVPIRNGRISLGTWQGIFFCEFDGPRTRKMIVQVVST